MAPPRVAAGTIADTTSRPLAESHCKCEGPRSGGPLSAIGNQRRLLAATHLAIARHPVRSQVSGRRRNCRRLGCLRQVSRCWPRAATLRSGPVGVDPCPRWSQLADISALTAAATAVAAPVGNCPSCPDRGLAGPVRCLPGGRGRCGADPSEEPPLPRPGPTSPVRAST